MIISHDLAVVEYLCDRILVMYLGKVIERAPYAALYGTPKHPYTQALLSAAPVSDPLREKTASSCFTATCPALSIRQAAAGFIPAAPKKWRSVK
jgi:oligopeptide/dipeptide ABC transporter ATP-binding protein